MAYSVDELIRTLLEIKYEGYSYCELSIDDENVEREIIFAGLDDGGFVGCTDFDTVKAVPEEEILEYANVSEEPAEIRNPINLRKTVMETVSESQETETGTKEYWRSITTYYIG